MGQPSFTELSTCNLPPARTSIASALLQEARHRPAEAAAAALPSRDHDNGMSRRHELRRDSTRAERLQFVIDVLDEALAIPFEPSLHVKPATTTSKTFANDR
jgi:hypothetical protein